MGWSLTLLMFIAGGIGGFFVHALTMKISFKQRTIDNKIRVYDSIIVQWVKTRNFIYNVLLNDPNRLNEFDILYGESQTFVGEAILVSEDYELIERINDLNEKLYRTGWIDLCKNDQDWSKANEIMEDIKEEAWQIIEKMRKDVRDSTVFDRSDLSHIFSGLFGKKRRFNLPPK